MHKNMSLRPKRVLFEDLWPQLEQYILRILYHTDIESLSFMDAFQLVYDLCNAFPKPHIRQLLVNLRQMVDDYCLKMFEKLRDCQQFLPQIYSQLWTAFQMSSKWLHFVFGYLNRLMMSGDLHFTKQHLDASYRKTCVEALAYSSWKQSILLPLKHSDNNRLMSQLFDMIDEDRRGPPVDFDVGQSIKTTVESLVLVNQFVAENPIELYLEMFEDQHLQKSRYFYEQESGKIAATVAAPQFTRRIEQWLSAERMRCLRFCNSLSTERVMRCCEQELISRHLGLFKQEFTASLNEWRLEDLSRCYRLLKFISDGPQQIRDGFEDHIVSQGHQLTSIADMNDVLRGLIELHSKYCQVLADQLSADVPLMAAMDKAFRRLVNGNIKNIAEIIARSADLLLKTQSANESGGVLSQLDDLLRMLKYVDSKDSFQKHYSRRLAQRLINSSSSTANDLEAIMITKLRDACGMEFSSRLQKMFTDIGLSEELSQRFRTINTPTELGGLHPSLLILTSGSWPFSVNSQKSANFIPPASISRCIDQFTQFYATEFNGRRLHWLHQLSRAEVRLLGFDKRYDLSVSVYQASLIDYFNSAPPLATIDSIASAVLLDMSDAKSALQPLLDIQLISKDRQDQLQINDSFTSKRVKFRVPAYSVNHQQQCAEQELSAIEKSVQDDRRYFLQAVIVRVMKAKRELLHNQLIQEVIELARPHFSPQVPAIKQCIEHLIDKQYLDRVPGKDSYQYIA